MNGVTIEFKNGTQATVTMAGWISNHKLTQRYLNLAYHPSELPVIPNPLTYIAGVVAKRLDAKVVENNEPPVPQDVIV